MYDSSTVLWRQGKGQQPTDQEKHEVNAGQSVSQLTGRTEEFNRQLREQPSDTELWLQYIKYQVGKSDFCVVVVVVVVIATNQQVSDVLYSKSYITSVNQCCCMITPEMFKSSLIAHPTPHPPNSCHCTEIHCDCVLLPL